MVRSHPFKKTHDLEGYEQRKLMNNVFWAKQTSP
jgi:hypothetical protein